MADYIVALDRMGTKREPTLAVLNDTASVTVGKVTNRSIAVNVPESSVQGLQKKLDPLGVSMLRSPTPQLMEPVPLKRILG